MHSGFHWRWTEQSNKHNRNTQYSLWLFSLKALKCPWYFLPRNRSRSFIDKAQNIFFYTRFLKLLIGSLPSSKFNKSSIIRNLVIFSLQLNRKWMDPIASRRRVNPWYGNNSAEEYNGVSTSSWDRRKRVLNLWQLNFRTAKLYSRRISLGQIYSFYNINWLLRQGGFTDLLGFWTFSIVRYSREYKTRRFGNRICYRPQVKEEKHLFSWAHSHVAGNRSSFRNVVFSSL
jgi:hypothetical protein